MITPLKPTKSQVVRPSGIIQSKDGKYFFWQCTVSGLKTFANEKRFLKLVVQYGSEEALFKSFVCKAAKKANPEVEAPVTKGSSTPKAKKAKGSTSEAPSLPKQPAPKEEVVYPWQKESNYFGNGKITPSPVPVEEVTKDSCMFPNRYLDDMCKGCPVYDKCVLASKYVPADWEDKSKRDARKVKIKQLVYEKAAE